MLNHSEAFFKQWEQIFISSPQATYLGVLYKPAKGKSYYTGIDGVMNSKGELFLMLSSYNEILIQTDITMYKLKNLPESN